MSLTRGDHLVIKRGDHIVSPEDGEAYHEFRVVEQPEMVSFGPDGKLIDQSYQWKEGDVVRPGYRVLVEVIR